jgi:CMP-N,N'-diacetyllegionaminic acid synthase
MRTLGIIPARAGSKRLPGKNLRLLGGRPLVSWVLEAAERSKRINHIVVSSDDPEVLELAGNHAVTRPSHLTSDDSPAIDYVRHALASLPNAGFDTVAILQPSSPFTEAWDIDGALELLEQSGADSVVTVCKVPFMYRPCKQLVMTSSLRMAEICSDGGDEPLYVRNGSVYATRASTIMQGRVIGDDCRGYVMPHSRSIDINDEDDFNQAADMMGIVV